ncbi:MAG: hypothetical protein WC679_00435 [Bacteroidales bacterium]|jgi:hypothetical protein
MKQICIDIIKKYPSYAERINDKKAFNFLVGEVIKEVGKTANIKLIVAELKVLLNYTVPDKEKKEIVVDKPNDKGYYFIISNNPTLFCFSKDKTIKILDVRMDFEETGNIPENCETFDYDTNEDTLSEDAKRILILIRKNLICY